MSYNAIAPAQSRLPVSGSQILRWSSIPPRQTATTVSTLCILHCTSSHPALRRGYLPRKYQHTRIPALGTPQQQHGRVRIGIGIFWDSHRPDKRAQLSVDTGNEFSGQNETRESSGAERGLLGACREQTCASRVKTDTESPGRKKSPDLAEIFMPALRCALYVTCYL